jgi:hypothetical protein
MEGKYTLRIYQTFIAAAVLALALTPCGRAQLYRSCCEPSSEVHQSPFFGYYRTCWRPWPGGQPVCPRYPIPESPGPAVRPGTSERAIELLPLPRPEEPELK